MSNAFNFMGASAYMWSIMHNQAHHMYTNIDGHDEDMETLPIIRFSPKQKYMNVHKYQHIYSFFFFSCLKSFEANTNLFSSLFSEEIKLDLSPFHHIFPLYMNAMFSPISITEFMS